MLFCDEDVWATLSLLTHVTVVPAGTAIGFGAYAVADRSEDPAVIDTIRGAGPLGVGVGAGGGRGVWVPGWS